MIEQLEIVFSSPDVVIVNKPSGLLVHPTNKGEQDTLVARVLRQFPDVASVGEDATRPGIVHRLDKETSGLLAVARSQEVFIEMKEMFAQRKVHKKYYALVWGVPRDAEGVIEKQITSFKGKRRTVEVWSQQPPNKVRDAKTGWKVKERFGDRYALLDVVPYTGRMHQIRVHLASLGHPVVCDTLYSGKKKCPVELGRLFLHSYELHIPFQHNPVQVSISIPPSLESFLAHIRGAEV